MNPRTTTWTAEIFGPRPAPPLADDRAARLEAAAEAERIRREARRIVDAEDNPAPPIPRLVTLAERMAQPRPAIAWRINGWQPAGTRVLLTGPGKAGKTSLMIGLLRALVDGDPWLGSAAAMPIEGRVGLVDLEMSGAQLDDWFRQSQIVHPDRIVVASLRGFTAAFNLLDRDRRAAWASTLRAHDVQYLIVDCLRPILDALGLDEARDAGKFLVAFDALLREADVSEACLVHHHGHTNERARGDSRLIDWPDATWRMVRAEDGTRYIAAEGRDVSVPESRLSWDPETRRLTLAGGSRRDAARDAALDAIVDVLAAAGAPMTGRAIERALTDDGIPREAVRAAIRYGVQAGRLAAEPGPRRSKLYSALSAPVRRSAPPRFGALRPSECASAPPLLDSGALAHSGALAQSPKDDSAGAAHSTAAEDPSACLICGRETCEDAAACLRQHRPEWRDVEDVFGPLDGVKVERLPARRDTGHPPRRGRQSG
jgi:GTPase SAR1 family protein